MDTWSRNSTGSSLIWEWTSGMKPSQPLKAFMQVCRWAKWSGSAHREDLEPCSGGVGHRHTVNSQRPTCDIMVSLYCFFCVTLIGGCRVTAETRKFIRMSSQLAMRSTMVSRFAVVAPGGVAHDPLRETLPHSEGKVHLDRSARTTETWVEETKGRKEPCSFKRHLWRYEACLLARPVPGPAWWAWEFCGGSSEHEYTLGVPDGCILRATGGATVGDGVVGVVVVLGVVVLVLVEDARGVVVVRCCGGCEGGWWVVAVEDAVEREVVQKRTFTRWMNLHLEKCDPPTEVQDLFRDIQDGRILMALLEELSGCKLLHGFKKSSHRIFRLNNIAKVLTFLEERNVKLVSIDAADIADGNSSIILGLIWNIILFFQHGVVEGEAGGVREELGEGIESAGEGVPQQAAPGHVGVDAVLDDLRPGRDGETDGGRDGQREGWTEGGMGRGRDGQRGGMDRETDGGRDGWVEGGMDGRREGGMDGGREGGMDGRREGWTVGGRDGRREGWMEEMDGRAEGGMDGREGWTDGGRDGRREGGMDGRREGWTDGETDGGRDDGGEGWTDGGMDGGEGWTGGGRDGWAEGGMDGGEEAKEEG
ncbi:hypothetical protein CRUP_010631 [Coryphaenoides rupestris]|nr:hypothetical protein CRUP_010631 [Coryphaenoides rupestris]